MYHKFITRTKGAIMKTALKIFFVAALNQCMDDWVERFRKRLDEAHGY